MGEADTAQQIHTRPWVAKDVEAPKPGWNIMAAYDTDGSTLRLPYYRELHSVSHPAATIPNMGERIESPQDYPQPDIITADELSTGDKVRLREFMDNTKLPMVFKMFLALNTDESAGDWSFLKTDMICVGLTGMSEVGKTTYARELAQQGFPIIDMELFDERRPDRPRTVRETLQKTLAQIKQLGQTGNQGVVFLDANGMSHWPDQYREINCYDFISHATAEVGVSINRPDDRLHQPELERVAPHVDGIGNVATTRFEYSSPTVDAKAFSHTLLTHTELKSEHGDERQTVVQLGAYWRNGLTDWFKYQMGLY